jgi:hypothetical protein
VIDHHVDRPGVEARQRAKLTGPNRPTGSISPGSIELVRWSHPSCAAVIHTGWPPPHGPSHLSSTQQPESRSLRPRAGRHGPLGWTTWWPWRGPPTRSHPELGREKPQRPWYCVPRRGRVGRRQVFQPRDLPAQGTTPRISPGASPPIAGWSSPVARQAHNLKAAGSNPAPATNHHRANTPPESQAPRERSPEPPLLAVQSSSDTIRGSPTSTATTSLVWLPRDRRRPVSGSLS